MRRRRRDLFSVDAEPALGGGDPLQADPAEARVARRELRDLERAKSPAEIDALRDSILSEPSLDPATRAEVQVGRLGFADWLAAKKARVGFVALLAVTLLAGLAGGPWSVLGALLQGSVHKPIFFWIYAVAIGPLVEEMLKQSGALFLLERRPWWLKHGWQFPLIAVISAGLFATIENLMYIAGPLQDLPADEFAAAVAFRWRYCTLLHLACSLLAAVGMWRVWRRHVADGAPAQLHHGYQWIVSAVVAHGLYNFAVTFLVGPGR